MAASHPVRAHCWALSLYRAPVQSNQVSRRHMQTWTQHSPPFGEYAVDVPWPGAAGQKAGVRQPHSLYDISDSWLRTYVCLPHTDPPTTSLMRTKQHCLNGIHGTIRRSTDSWFVHLSVRTYHVIALLCHRCTLHMDLPSLQTWMWSFGKVAQQSWLASHTKCTHSYRTSVLACATSNSLHMCIPFTGVGSACLQRARKRTSLWCKHVCAPAMYNYRSCLNWADILICKISTFLNNNHMFLVLKLH